MAPRGAITRPHPSGGKAGEAIPCDAIEATSDGSHIPVTAKVGTHTKTKSIGVGFSC